jgi:dihydroorotase-like cyclic amidohydrolase
MSRARSKQLDLLLRGGQLFDSQHSGEVTDIGIRDGRIDSIGPIRQATDEVIDVAGYHVLPGLVDLHVHTSSEFSGRAAHAMMAKAGVTTALDLAGPVDDVRTTAARFGVGLTIGCVEALVPERNVPAADVTGRQLRNAVSAAIRGGACGIKVLGGHFPLTPEATTETIAIADDLGIWAAVHCGTTTADSDLAGLEQLLQLRDERPLHIAHISSYCRGAHAPRLAEAQRAIELLTPAHRVFTESYISRINGTWGTCVDGRPISGQTRAALRAGGFEETQEGLERALTVGYASTHAVRNNDVQLETGAAGLSVWRAADTRIGMSFPVNDVGVGIVLAAARTAAGRFVIDAWATDGGGIPRNNTLTAGYGLVALGVLTLQDLVWKASTAPAAAFGLHQKGQLSEGADADLIVVEPSTGSVRLTIASGKVVAREGSLTPNRTAWLCFREGKQAVLSDRLVPIELERPLQPSGDASLRGGSTDTQRETDGNGHAGGTSRQCS